MMTNDTNATNKIRDLKIMNNPLGTNKPRKLVDPDVLYPELSYRIMEAVFEVHNQLGPGFGEEIYQNALVVELAMRKIPFETQKNVNVLYKGKPMGNYHLDLVIENKIILELKAVTDLKDLFKQQLTSYLKATGMRLGILINFGSRRVEYVRIVS
jgi:GxxExxY protein